MSGITATMISISQGLIQQIRVIVAALASLVGVSILVVYGFNKLKFASDERDYYNGKSYGSGNEYDDEEDNWDIPGFTDDSDRDSGDPTPQG